MRVISHPRPQHSGFNLSIFIQALTRRPMHLLVNFFLQLDNKCEFSVSEAIEVQPSGLLLRENESVQVQGQDTYNYFSYH